MAESKVEKKEEVKVDIKNLNIFEKMSLATNKIGWVAKKMNVKLTENASYKAVAEADVLDAVKEAEQEYGIYSYPFDRNILESDVLETVKYDKQKKELFVRIETIYRFVNIHKPSEYIDVKSYAEGIDSGDKCSGKAMTYSDKYALLKAYKIQTGDDPDADASGDLNGSKKKGDLPKETKKEAVKETVKEPEKQEGPKMISPDQINILKHYYGKEEAIWNKFLEKNNIAKIEEMPYSIATLKIEACQKVAEKTKTDAGIQQG